MGHTKTVVSTCMGCMGSCGAVYEVEDNKIVKIKPDPDNPVSRGYMCPKGQAIEEMRSSPERLLYPLKRAGDRGEGKWKQISWQEAIDEMADRFGRTRADYGPESFVLSIGFAGVLSGLNPVTSKFLHHFGSPNQLEDLHN
jgi:anaerobic selenocysteine-containing dehydrogenase